MTARSLPAKVENEESSILIDQNVKKQQNLLNSLGVNSSPLISTSQVKLIQVSPRIINEKEEAFTFEQNLPDDKMEISSRNVSLNFENKFCDKTNLDKYLEYTLSPFTTKFEIMGNVYF